LGGNLNIHSLLFWEISKALNKATPRNALRLLHPTRVKTVIIAHQ
jgi:hypothetical protein